MPVFRVAVISLLMAALAWGQAGTPAAAGSAASTAATPPPQDPAQPLQSPLQEPVKPTEAQLNQPKASAFDVSTQK
jgi:hypothetical protein